MSSRRTTFYPTTQDNTFYGAKPPNLGWEGLPLTTAFDKTTYMNGGSVITNGSGYNEFTVPGGLATPKPSEAVSVLWRAKDIDGSAASSGVGEMFRSLLLRLRERGAPNTSGDSYHLVGLVDNSDLTLANGVFVGIVYTAASRRLRGLKLQGNVVTVVDSGAIAGFDTTFLTANQADDSFPWKAFVACYADPTWNVRRGTLTPPNLLQVAGDLYVVETCGRTTALAGAVTLAGQGAYLPTKGVAMGEGL